MTRTQKEQQLRAVKQLQKMRGELKRVDRVLAKLQWTMRLTRKPHELLAATKRSRR